MAITSQHKTIEGTEVTVTMFPARRGLKLKLKLAQKLLPGLSKFMAGQTSLDELGNSNVNASSIFEAIEAAVMTMSEDEFMSLVMEILSQSRYGTNGGAGGREFSAELIDMEFAGDYAKLYKVLWFALEVNYGDFFRKGLSSITSESQAAPVKGTTKSK